MSKDTIHLDWLRFDPEVLAKAVPVSATRTVSSRDIEKVDREQAPGLAEAFGAWFGVRTKGMGGIYAADWEAFLGHLRRAKALATEPDFEPPADGIVYRGP